MKWCHVCQEGITDADEIHTYHAEGCPRRDELNCEDAECYRLSGCNEDVHAQCCPTCTGQAF